MKILICAKSIPLLAQPLASIQPSASHNPPATGSHEELSSPPQRWARHLRIRGPCIESRPLRRRSSLIIGKYMLFQVKNGEDMSKDVCVRGHGGVKYKEDRALLERELPHSLSPYPAREQANVTSRLCLKAVPELDIYKNQSFHSGALLGLID